MRTKWIALPMAWILSFAASAQQPPIASQPIVNIEGKIEKVQIAQGQGTPSIELRSTQKVVRVILGPMRFLMQNNFNPKVGQQAKVQGYHFDPDVVAITIEIPAEKKVLKLRDENGRPLWRGGVMTHSDSK